MLADRFGRIVRDLRISVTDRCDLRCSYCLPALGVRFMPGSQLLSCKEFSRLAKLLRSLGVERVRLTGGEPLLRADLEDIISSLGHDIDIALTSNGVNLAERAQALADAGLTRITISLDSLDRAKYESITRRDRLSEVLAGIDASLQARLQPVKINTVIERGVNDDEVEKLVEFAMRLGLEVRFIEWMPLDASGSWDRSRVVPVSDLRARVQAMTSLIPRVRGSAPAQSFSFANAPGGVGFIGTVTESFCGKCDRIRLTADGMLKTCLFDHHEFNLREPMRAGAGDDALAEIIRAAVAAKPAGHTIGSPRFTPPKRSMSAVGG